MTQPAPGQVTVLIGHPLSNTSDPAALNAARSAVFGQLALLAAAHHATDPAELYYCARWLHAFYPGSTFFFGVDEHAGTVIGKDEKTVADQSRLMWRIDTAINNGKPWTATITTASTGHQSPAAQEMPATITVTLRADTIRALVMATVRAEGEGTTELRHARLPLLWAIRRELRENPGADRKDWMNWMPDMVFGEYERLPSY